jgi:hypothetical protein
MNRVRMTWLAVMVGFFSLLLRTEVSAVPQTKDQQKCINKINKDGIKVQAAQGKENTECVKRKNNDELPGASDAERCLTADPRGKVALRKTKTLADEAKFCTGVGVPEFGYTSAANVNQVAVQAELDLIHDVFGGPPVDDGLYSRNPFVFEAVCQRNVVNRVEKLIQTMGREFVKCKKNALALRKQPFLNGAAEGSDLEVCVDDPTVPNSVAADSKGKIAKRQQNLLGTITNQCDPANLTRHPFPGACDLLQGAALQACLIDLTRCHFCQMINSMDGIGVDCGLFAGPASPACR